MSDSGKDSEKQALLSGYDPNPTYQGMDENSSSQQNIPG